jgi:hypothetical protein
MGAEAQSKPLYSVGWVGRYLEKLVHPHHHALGLLAFG